MSARANAVQINRSHLVDRLARKHKQLTRHDIDEAVKLVFGQIAAGLSRDERVELRGFGSFNLRQRPQRIAHNPRTGQAVALPSRLVLHFKPGKRLRENLRYRYQQ